MNIDKGLKHLKQADKKMGQLIAEFEKPEFQKNSNYFEALVRAIVYQQLSGKAAAKIYNRFKDLFSKKKYPSPFMVMERSHEELRSICLSNQKASYIHNIANAFLTGMVPNDINTLSDNDVIECLTTIKGVGPWTAEMFLMFAYKRRDIFSIGDIALRRAISEIYDVDKEDQKKIISIADVWTPHRSIVCWYLWEYLGV